MKEHETAKSLRIAQKRLAFEVTALVHGSERALSVERLSKVLFDGISHSTLKSEDFKAMGLELNTVDVPMHTPLVNILVATKLASSNTDARRFLQDNAVYINGSQFSSDKINIDQEDVLLGKYIVIKRGKNATALVRISN